MLRQCDGGFRWSGAALKRCRAALLVVLTVAGITSAARANARAEGTTDEVKAMLGNKDFQEALFLSKRVNPYCTPVVFLVLNHETLEWSVYHSRPPKSGKASGEGTFQAMVTKDAKENEKLLGPDGNPRVVRSGDEKVVLVVTNANPFLYSYQGTVSAPVESPDATAMRSAFSAMESAISGILGAVKERNPADYSERLSSLQKLVNVRDGIQLYVRALETGVDDLSNPPKPKVVSDDAEAGLKALDSLETEARAWNLRPCYQTWFPLLRLWGLPRIEDGELMAAGEEMIKARGIIETLLGKECQGAGVVKEAFEILGELQGSRKPEERPGKLSDYFNKHSDEASNAWKALCLEKVISAKKDFLAAATQIAAYIRLARTQALGPKEGDNWIWPLSSRVAVVAPPFPFQTWLKDNPGTISIKTEMSVYPECIRQRPIGVDKKFFLVSRQQTFLGVGFGFIFTKIKAPTFGVLSPDANGQGKIGIKAEESRMGTIVAMLFVRPRPLFIHNAQPWTFEPGIELGASLDSHKPGIYLGPSLEIYHFVRVSVGGTYQAINSLADGLNLNDPYYTGGDVPTQNKPKFGLYFGLTFALDALPLFSPSK